MSLFRRQALAAPPDDAREVLDAAVASLRAFRRRGTASVPVADVLEMLGAPPEAAPAQVSRDPQADPLTGCRSVLPC